MPAVPDGLRSDVALARLEAQIARDRALVEDLEAELAHRRRKLEIRQQSRAMMIGARMERS